MENNDRYAIGQQDFRTLRRRGALYVDKTRFVEKTAYSKTQYYFLARPRRLGICFCRASTKETLATTARRPKIAKRMLADSGEGGRSKNHILNL